MKRYWQFALVGLICLLVALLWAQPPRGQAQLHLAAVSARSAQESTPGTAQKATGAAKSPTESRPQAGSNDDSLPGSSSSLPLLAVIGFGVLAGGITSAMRTRH